MKLLLLEMSQIQIISKDFKCSSQVINNKKHELKNLASKNHCLITITSSSAQRTVSPTSTISSESINISNGDIIAEPVKSEIKKI
jgi:hypothetical protein